MWAPLWFPPFCLPFHHFHSFAFHFFFCPSPSESSSSLQATVLHCLCLFVFLLPTAESPKEQASYLACLPLLHPGNGWQCIPKKEGARLACCWAREAVEKLAASPCRQMPTSLVSWANGSVADLAGGSSSCMQFWRARVVEAGLQLLHHLPGPSAWQPLALTPSPWGSTAGAGAVRGRQSDK